MERVELHLGERSYSVLCEYGLLKSLSAHLDALEQGKNCAVITDSNVAPHYLQTVLDQLEIAGYSASSHVVTAGEASKSMKHVEQLCREMTQARHGRTSFVIALGGGVVGDLAGFVASVFYRGIPFIQIPTTIVAQVDSSVGGKTGVNIAEGKNLVGAFHQPKLVLIDPAMLATLPGREYREGYAEVIKHAAIWDAEMVDELAQLDPNQQCPPAELIARNVAIKARVVEQDEQERSGTRALLNFGHTIGHAIEASVPYGELLHGEAIALGIRAAIFLSQQHAALSEHDGRKVLELLRRFSLPLSLPEKITTDTVMDKLATDKKFEQGAIRFVLLHELGRAFVSDQITNLDIEEAISFLRT